jgi:hypothetical protein
MVRRNPLWKVYSDVNNAMLSRNKNVRIKMAIFFLEWGGGPNTRLLRRKDGMRTDAFFRRMFDLDGLEEGGWHIVIDAMDFVNT